MEGPSSGGSKRTLDETNLYDCPVCLEDMTDKQPRSLRCLHTFCTTCLETLVQQDQSNYLACPKCRKRTRLDDVNSLPINFDLKNMKERERELSMNHTFCSICLGRQTRERATYFCIQCNHKLCEACTNRHSSSPVFKTHKLIGLDTTDGDNSRDKCSKHHDRIKYVCCECYEGLCTFCVHDQQHENHQERIKKFDEGKKMIESSNNERNTLLTNLSTMASTIQEVLTKDQKRITELEDGISRALIQVKRWRKDIEKHKRGTALMLETIAENKELIDTSVCQSSEESFEKVKQNKDKVDKVIKTTGLAMQTASYTCPEMPEVTFNISHHRKFYLSTLADSDKFIFQQDEDGKFSSERDELKSLKFPATSAGSVGINEPKAGTSKDCPTLRTTLDPNFPQRISSCSCQGIKRLFEILPWEEKYWYEERTLHMVDRKLINLLSEGECVKIKSAGKGEITVAQADGANIAYLTSDGQLYAQIAYGKEIKAVAIHEDTVFIANVDFDVNHFSKEMLNYFYEVETDKNRIDLDNYRDTPETGDILDMIIPEHGRILITISPRNHSGRIIEYDLNASESSLIYRGLRNPDRLTCCSVNGSMWYIVKSEKRILLFDREWNKKVTISSFGPEDFDQPTGIAMTATGLVLVADSGLGRVGLFHLNGTFCRYILCKHDIWSPQDLVLSGSQLWVSHYNEDEQCEALSSFTLDDEILSNLCDC